MNEQIKPIQILTEETINQIAAGEVVERPVNVVKELAENALDAGATAITCEIREGGLRLIRITDNGCGIPASEVEKAFLRHATSKITSATDLHDLSSLGFRGEALSSIAAVSRLEMITKPSDALTAVRVCDPGTAEAVREDVGAPAGTSVMVRDLFYNVPVRRGFLKAPSREAAAVTDLMEQLALSHPEVSFHYRLDGKERFHTSGNGDRKEILYRIYGKEVYDRLLPVQASDGEMALTGYIGKPEISRGSRAFEFFFVNGRIIKNETLSAALEEGYGTDLMQHRFPFAVLFLDLPPRDVDVNIHPTKKEARFRKPDEVFSFIRGGVQQVFAGSDRVLRTGLDTAKEEREKAHEEEKARLLQMQKSTHVEPFETGKGLFTASVTAVSDAVSSPETTAYEPALSYGASDAAPADLLPEEASPYVQETLPVFSAAHAPSFRLIGQAFLTYWMVEWEEQLLFIDQHAAHEKVQYERLMQIYRERESSPAPSQELMPAAVLQVNGREEAALSECREVLEDLGFRLEELGPSAYAVRAVPLSLYETDPAELLRSVLEEHMAERKQGDPGMLLQRIATMSCKAAVKGNTLLKEEEARTLIAELLTLENPYRCPHGRPTTILFSKQELERKFKRIV